MPHLLRPKRRGCRRLSAHLPDATVEPPAVRSRVKRWKAAMIQHGEPPATAPEHPVGGRRPDCRCLLLWRSFVLRYFAPCHECGPALPRPPRTPAARDSASWAGQRSAGRWRWRVAASIRPGRAAHSASRAVAHHITLQPPRCLLLRDLRLRSCPEPVDLLGPFLLPRACLHLSP